MALRYGSYSIERMINTLIAKGAKRERLVTKVFGGGNVIAGNANVGHRNADFVEEYLARERCQISARNLRGSQARKIRFFPTTGKVQMTLLGGEAIKSVVRSEDHLRKAPEIATKHGTVEFFE
jgi:chemotaxis protein CheD